MNDSGLRNVPCEQSFYILAHKYKYMIVLISTDDLLCFCHGYMKFHIIHVHMQKYSPAILSRSQFSNILTLRIYSKK